MDNVLCPKMGGTRNTRVPRNAYLLNNPAICLAAAAGYTDRYGVGQFNTFVSFMSGNRASTGAYVGQGKVHSAQPETVAAFFSNVTQEHIERARQIVPIVSVQNRYSFADREWDYVVEYCERNGIVFIPWFLLAAGRIPKQVLAQIAQAHNVLPTQLALAWLLRRSPVILPIPGTSSVEHLEQNIAATSLRLSDEEYETLLATHSLSYRADQAQRDPKVRFVA